MKVLFITPYDNNYRYKSAFTKSLSYMPLTMPYLAALIPEKYNAKCRAIDEGVEKVNYDKLEFYDIVAITSVTSSVKRGYELAAYFKGKGSYVVMGGHHVTLMPDEAAEYADTVMTGPADRIFREFIEGFANSIRTVFSSIGGFLFLTVRACSFRKSVKYKSTREGCFCIWWI